MNVTIVRLIARDIGLKFKHQYCKELTLYHVPLANDIVTLRDDALQDYAFEVSSREHILQPYEYFRIWLKQHSYTEEKLKELGFTPIIPAEEA